MPPYHTACLGQFYRDTKTNTQRHLCTHTYIELQINSMHPNTGIYLYMHLQCIHYASHICTHVMHNLTIAFSDIIILLHFYDISSLTLEVLV